MALFLAVVVSLLVAASLRLPGVVSTALGAYVVLVADIGLATWSLSLGRAVTPTGLAIEQAVFAVLALAVWWWRGRPVPEFAPAVAALRGVAADPVVVAFLLVAAAALAYELVLAVSVPPTNWDSLTYHLARVAAWRQHGGIYWIPDAPTARMNDFQPLAEQEILYLLVATGTTAVVALPQYVAELAILVAVYGCARRLGFGVRAAACSAALLATFSLLALEATTAQNDLVSASLPVAAACLLLGATPAEAVLAGIAVALGVGAKLTTVLVLPVIAWLAWNAGRRTAKLALAGLGGGLLGVGIWTFVLNLAETGDPLGSGQGRTEHTALFSPLGSLRTFVHLLDRLIDLSVLGDWTVGAFAVAGIVAGVLTWTRSRRSGDRRQAALTTAAVALPLLAPAIVLALVQIPAGDPANVQQSASEDYSAFGPLGTVALVAAPIIAVVAFRARHDQRKLALAISVPVYMVLLALYAQYDIWITRFLIVPVVLTAPLFAYLFRTRAATATILVVAAVTVSLTLVRDGTKPLVGTALARPWNLTQAQAVAEGPARQTAKRVGAMLTVYNREVPERACVGAVMDPDDFSYLLWGPSLARHVIFLPSLTALQSAYEHNLRYVVISNGANAPVAKQFAGAGWRIKPLATWWILAVSPHSTDSGTCH